MTDQDRSTVAATLLVLAIPVSIVAGRAAAGVAIGLSLALLAIFCLYRRRWPPFVQSRPLWVITGVLAIAWIPSVASSLNPLASFGVLVRMVGCLVLGALGYAMMAESRARVLHMVFLVAFTAALVFATLTITAAPDLVGFRARGPFRVELMFKASASIVACALPVALAIGWRLGGYWRWCAVIATGLGIILMVITHSKSSGAGLLTAVGCALILTLTRPFSLGWRAGIWVLVLAGVGFGLHWGVAQKEAITMGGFPQFAPVWMVDAHRQVIWQYALELFLQRPWMGWGLGVISSAPGASDHIPELNAEFIPSHTHDWVVQILSEAGVIGFLPLAAVVVGGTLLAARRWYRQGDVGTLAMLCLWVTFWSAGLFNFSFWNAWWQSSMAVLSALALASSVDRGAPKS